MTFVERLERELELAVEARALAEPVPAEERSAPPLSAQPVLKYAVVEEAERYRRLMRVLFLENQSFGLPLTPSQVGARAREQFGLELDAEALDAALDQLHAWGALHRDYDTSLVTRARDLRRRRFTYDISAAGKRAEVLLRELDGLTEAVGVLDGNRLPEIRDALARLGRELAEERPDGAALRRELERLLDEVGRLHDGASDFMSRLNRIIVTSEQVDEEEFEQCKAVLVEHLQGFRGALRRHADEIAERVRAVDALGPERLAAEIVAAEELLALPGFSAEQLAAQRHNELLEQWRGARAWFLGVDGRSSPWAALAEKVVDAIRAVLDIAERLIDRRVNRASRARACEHLARLVHDAPAAEAQALLSAALGWAPPRHLGTPEADPDAVHAPAATSWLEAPPASVLAHLRRPGGRAPGAGTGAPIRRAGELGHRVAERRAAERVELERALERFQGRGAVRLSSIARLDHGDFRHLLGWIGRAFEAPAGDDGTRRAAAHGGRARIVLRAPRADVPRVVLQTPHGRFETADYALEVIDT
jgi:uncharacterized protein (TIGR02677 family)